MRHLILQLELSLLQRFLFVLFLGGDLLFADELVQAVLAAMVFFHPLPELRILGRENLLNLKVTIRHRFPSFEGPVQGKF